MSIHTLCRQIVEEGALEQTLAALRVAEAGFTRERGVLERRFWQCEQQPHVVWARTEWTSQRAHDDAAESLMKVRRDDRVASAYFRPGLYFELFALPLAEGTARFEDGVGERIVVCHGLVNDRRIDGWPARMAARLARFEAPPGLFSIATYWNYEARGEFVGFLEWRDAAAFEGQRALGARTLEEELFVEPGRSDLAAYTQYECRPLAVCGAGCSSEPGAVR